MDFHFFFTIPSPESAKVLCSKSLKINFLNDYKSEKFSQFFEAKQRFYIFYIDREPQFERFDVVTWKNKFDQYSLK